MSLTSYRAAPPRDGPVRDVRVDEIVNGFRYRVMHVARASMPGDDLLFHRLSDSTIGAVGFHGRVRDGIGWFHSAMVARERVEGRSGFVVVLRTELCAHALIGWEVASFCGDTCIDVLSRVRRLEVI